MRKHKGAGAIPAFPFPDLGRTLLGILAGTGGEQQCHVLQAELLHSSLRRKKILSYFSSGLLSGGFVLPSLSTRSGVSPVLLKAPLFMNATERTFLKLKFDLRHLIFWKQSLLQWAALHEKDNFVLLLEWEQNWGFCNFCYNTIPLMFWWW